MFSKGADNGIWDKASNTLSGVLCSSINLVDHAALLRPIADPRSCSSDFQLKECELKRAFLPHESLCTENITPWLELLPCSNKVNIRIISQLYKGWVFKFIGSASDVVCYLSYPSIANEKGMF